MFSAQSPYLMKAVKRFNPEMGVRLVSFAVHWIKAEIHEFILRNWRIVKVATTKAQRKLFFNLRKSKKRLGWMNAEEVRTVAKDLGVPEATVRESFQRMRQVGLGLGLTGLLLILVVPASAALPSGMRLVRLRQSTRRS